MSIIAGVLAVATVVVIGRQDASEEPTVPARPLAQSATEPVPQEPVESRPRQEARPQQEAGPREKPDPKPTPTPPPVEQEESPSARPAPLLGEAPRWPMPQEGELGRLRRFESNSGMALTLTVPSLGVYDAPIFDSDSEQALEAGVAHVPETSMPWDRGAQRNVYLAAHRLGYSGTGSRLLFYELDKLRRGDAIVLEGRGKTYRYRVSETLVVDPLDSWVMGKELGRDMVSLQTCTPIPTFEKRLVVRADRT